MPECLASDIMHIRRQLIKKIMRGQVMSIRDRKFWLIQGLVETSQCLCSTLPIRTSKKEVNLLLQRLAARHLSAEAIIDFSRSKKARSHNRILEVESDGGHSWILSLSDKVRYVARVCSEFEYLELSEGKRSQNVV